ncbi:unnamed protein product [Echinostoma caproni]|uniref:Dymeclin n=1 Tax=Echinostoma caproni TaxID=27848 RepID=A0A3P8KZS5_9TREM|nr:unnamed protein product [Echinostoma caproni]
MALYSTILTMCFTTKYNTPTFILTGKTPRQTFVRYCLRTPSFHLVLFLSLLTHSFQVQELSLLEEVIRMILEILNSILTHVLSDNANLIYSLLHQREHLAALRSHPSFQVSIQSVQSSNPWRQCCLFSTLTL